LLLYKTRYNNRADIAMKKRRKEFETLEKLTSIARL
jgi:hypothetical protein